MRSIDGDYLRLTLLGWREVAVENGNVGAVVLINQFLSTLDHEPTIEKDVPKKPELEEGFYRCPVCGGDERYLIYETDLYCRFNYCGNCGQKLKWEDDPEVRQYSEKKCKLSSLYGTVMSESEDVNNG